MVTVGGRTLDAMADAVEIDVGGPAPYQVLVGRDVLGTVPSLLPGASRVAVLSTPSVAPFAAAVRDHFAGVGVTALPIDVPDAESAKSIDVASGCWDALGATGFTRSDAIVGVGGGAVSDLAGFVAACWLRGVRVVHVPTSLLGMVDAAVGGKTGVNTAAGKNLVGAFHPPAGVVCDLSTLDTLPAADLAAGLVEVVKCGFIADPEILRVVEHDPIAAREPSSSTVADLVERAVRVKAAVVAEDLRESGLREILNYGHTLAHAIEKRERYGWRHGDAVAVGLVFAAELGRLAGRLDAATATRHRTVLAALGLPVTYAADAWPELRDTMRVDKKTRGAVLRFIVLDGLGKPGVLADPPEEQLREAYAAVAA
jgi:3-dehydroquinate synthase